MVEHYYGDIVRKLFIAGSIVMMGALPFFLDEVREPLIVSITAILIVSVAAGLTSPRYSLSPLIDVCVAASAVIVFEWYAINTYRTEGHITLFFLLNQGLAMIFLVALYHAVKTLRAIRRVAKKAIASDKI